MIYIVIVYNNSDRKNPPTILVESYASDMCLIIYIDFLNDKL